MAWRNTDGDVNWSGVPIVKKFVPDSGQVALQGAIGQSKADTQAYRPAYQDAQSALIGNQMSLYAPYNEAMGRIYGQDAMQNLDPSAFAPVAPDQSVGGQKPQAQTDKERKAAKRKSFGKRVGAGAASGAAIGSKAGAIGAAAGAVVGGIAGAVGVDKESRSRRSNRRKDRRARRRS